MSSRAAQRSALISVGAVVAIPVTSLVAVAAVVPTLTASSAPSIGGVLAVLAGAAFGAVVVRATYGVRRGLQTLSAALFAAADVAVDAVVSTARPLRPMPVPVAGRVVTGPVLRRGPPVV